jgi:hypothetical protein
LSEQNKTATLILNADLQSYSDRIGNAHRLPSGSYHFDSGAIGDPPLTQSVEVSADGTVTFILEAENSAYRTFRLRNMYAP